MRTVILDTNFLLVPHQFKINVMVGLERLIEGPHELAVSAAIISELKGIAVGRGKAGAAARIALEAIRRKRIKTIRSAEKDADTWILHYCRETPETIVCTNDADLRRKVKTLGCRAITMKSRARIGWA